MINTLEYSCPPHVTAVERNSFVLYIRTCVFCILHVLGLHMVRDICMSPCIQMMLVYTL